MNTLCFLNYINMGFYMVSCASLSFSTLLDFVTFYCQSLQHCLNWYTHCEESPRIVVQNFLCTSTAVHTYEHRALTFVYTICFFSFFGGVEGACAVSTLSTFRSWTLFYSSLWLRAYYNIWYLIGTQWYQFTFTECMSTSLVN